MRDLLPALAVLALTACLGDDSGKDDTGPGDTSPGDTSVEHTGADDTGTGTDDTGTGEWTALLTPGFEASLSHTRGCADTWLYAYSDDDTVGLELYVRGPLERADALGGDPLVETLTVGTDDLKLYAFAGSELHEGWCTDDISGDPTITETWTATSGTVTLTVRATVPDGNGEADLKLTDVVFTSESGLTLTVADFEHTGINITRYWGG